MKKGQKILTSALAIVLVIALSVGGTIAYLTAKTETLNNVFTVGNVKIELYESRLDRENGYYGEGKIEQSGSITLSLWEGTQSQRLMVDDVAANTKSESEYATEQAMGFSDEQIIEDAANYQSYLGDGKLIPGGTYYSKFAYVKNTGSEDAYVRIHMYVPISVADLFLVTALEGLSANGAGPNWRGNAYIEGGWNSLGSDAADRMYPKVDDVEFAVNNFELLEALNAAGLNLSDLSTIEAAAQQNLLVTEYVEDEDGNQQPVYYIDLVSTRIKPLEPGEMTYWGRGFNFGIPAETDFDGISYDNDILNYLYALGKIGTTEDGAIQLAVKVFAEAIQADGFDSMEDAWEAFDAQRG